MVLLNLRSITWLRCFLGEFEAFLGLLGTGAPYPGVELDKKTAGLKAALQIRSEASSGPGGEQRARLAPRFSEFSYFGDS